MAALNFTDVKTIGLKGPFNASGLTFNVFADPEGGYHFNYYHRDKTSDARAKTRSASQVFARLQPCCSKKRVWNFKEDSGWYQGSSEISATDILQTRRRLVDAINLSTKLKEKSASSSEIFEALLHHNSSTVFLSLSALSGSGLEKTNWYDEYQKGHAKDLVKIIELFKASDQQAVINRFAKLVSDPVPKSLDPVITNLKRKANREIWARLSDPSQQYLVNLLQYEDPTVRTIRELYSIGAESFFVLPLAVATYLDQHKMNSPAVKLSAPLEPATLEALKVLYKPQGSGPYSDLAKAYKAALLL